MAAMQAPANCEFFNQARPTAVGIGPSRRISGDRPAPPQPGRSAYTPPKTLSGLLVLPPFAGSGVEGAVPPAPYHRRRFPAAGDRQELPCIARRIAVDAGTLNNVGNAGPVPTRPRTSPRLPAQVPTTDDFGSTTCVRSCGRLQRLGPSAVWRGRSVRRRRSRNAFIFGGVDLAFSAILHRRRLATATPPGSHRRSAPGRRRSGICPRLRQRRHVEAKRSLPE